MNNQWILLTQMAGAKSKLTAKQLRNGILQDARNSKRDKKKKGAR